MTVIQPMTFEPLLKRIRWGGRKLGTLLNKPIGPEKDYAESWEIADLDNDQTVVANGPCAGWSLHRVVQEAGNSLFGSGGNHDHFPLLIKFLDAHDRLSVQVHPNDAQARKVHPQAKGKTEAWVILAADNESRIYAGLKKGVDRKQFEQAMQEDRIEQCLHQFPVEAGDCIFIPAGTVHAISEGIVLAEIQQTCNITYRLYDWGRLGSDGQPRELHIEQALEVINFDQGPISPVVPNVVQESEHEIVELINSDFFHLIGHTTTTPVTLQTEGRFRILVVLEGEGTWTSDGTSHPLHRGQTLLVPASCPELGIVPDLRMVFLETFVP